VKEGVSQEKAAKEIDRKFETVYVGMSKIEIARLLSSTDTLDSTASYTDPHAKPGWMKKLPWIGRQENAQKGALAGQNTPDQKRAADIMTEEANANLQKRKQEKRIEQLKLELKRDGHSDDEIDIMGMQALGRDRTELESEGYSSEEIKRMAMQALVREFDDD